jgi:hypothetical protein
MAYLLSIFEHQVARVVEATYDFQDFVLGGLDISQTHWAGEFNFVSQQNGRPRGHVCEDSLGQFARSTTQRRCPESAIDRTENGLQTARCEPAQVFEAADSRLDQVGATSASERHPFDSHQFTAFIVRFGML